MSRILITLGDPAGIGPEVIDRAWPRPTARRLRIRSARRPLRGDPRPTGRALGRRRPGRLEQAVAELKQGRAAAVVTGPVSKEALQAIGFPFPGQTEYFAHAFGVADFGMLLTGNSLTVGLATIHEPLAKVLGLLSTERISSDRQVHRRIPAAPRHRPPAHRGGGLNPHAGENGAFGDEESRIILPAIRRLNECGAGIFTGPAVPDAVFREAAHGQFDAVLAMYHDQGLIPLKLLDFDTAVNVTLGLPKPRTSPDHGTAFAIAGKNLADPSSMIAAIRLACELT